PSARAAGLLLPVSAPGSEHKGLCQPTDEVRIEVFEQTLAALEHREVSAGPGRDVRELGGDITSPDQHQTPRQLLERQKILARGQVLLAGDTQRHRLGAGRDQEVAALQDVALDRECASARESGAPWKLSIPCSA
ncbi:MAG TPA: hypothetical protein VFU61_07850, partial [Steroidobacteraceae bacterium]|nr:hypothetical protein [Steroidobacteraceae bacterium]